jgi:hypothetical protein
MEERGTEYMVMRGITDRRAWMKVSLSKERYGKRRRVEWGTRRDYGEEKKPELIRKRRGYI